MTEYNHWNDYYIPWRDLKKDIQKIIINEGITYICNLAFSSCSNLKTVFLPNSVTTIGEQAFGSCSSLTSIIIPESVTTIGNSAFSSCSSLTNVTIPNSVTTIGERAFYGCTSLTNVTIPNSVTTIGERAFYECSSLTAVTIPSSVISIGNEIFYGCSNLASITVESQNTNYSSLEGVLYNKERTTLINYPSKKQGAFIIPNTVQTIYEYAFTGSTRLTNVTIPNSVTTIGRNAFLFCSSLTSINIPNSVTTIEEGAFYGCSGLTNVIIPNSVTTIGGYAFMECSSLASVTIGNSVTTIGDGAFKECSSLASVAIGNSVTTIGGSAFQNCSSLTSVTIPNSVTKIGSNAFQYCYNLTSVTIGNSVTTIGDYAFDHSNLTSVTIPNSVTTIGYQAFGGCSSLTSLTIGNSIKEITAGLFGDEYDNHNSLMEIYLGTSVEEIGAGTFTSNYITDVYLFSTTPVWIYPTSFSNPEAITFHVPAGCKQAYLDSQDLWKSYTIVEDGSEATNYAYVDAVGNSFALLLNYDDEEKNTVVIQDGYKSITVDEDILLKQISYERNFTNTSWQSLYVPFEIPVTAELLEDFELAYINAARQYDYDDDGEIDELTIEIFKVKSGTLRANHPYLIRAKETGMKAITVNEATLYATAANQVDCSTTSLSFTFKGAYETLTYNDIYDCRLLGGGKWNTPTSTTTMKPMRFYLKIASRGNEQVLPASSSAAPIRMTVWGEDGETTEIDDLQIADSEPANQTIFDMQGRPVEQPESGMYIINGKKVIVK